MLGRSYPSGRGGSGSAGVGCTVQQVTAVLRSEGLCRATARDLLCPDLPATSSVVGFPGLEGQARQE